MNRLGKNRLGQIRGCQRARHDGAPDLFDPDEQIGEEQIGRAIMAGALATAYLALSYAVSAFLLLLAGSQAPGSFQDPFDRLVAFIVYTMLVAIPLCITLLVWKKRSMAAAW